MASPDFEEEIVLPFPVPRSQIAAATQWRSTWVVSSIQTLKQRGHYDRYAALLPAARRDDVLLCVAGTWLPMPTARAHYEACNALGLTRAETLANGVAVGARAQGTLLGTATRVAVGARAQGTLLGTATRVATGAGVTPWTIVPHMQRLWQRGANGGASCVTKVGPKEGFIDTVGCELFDVPYFRYAFAGVIHGIVQLFSKQAYVHDETPAYARGECILRIQWA